MARYTQRDASSTHEAAERLRDPILNSDPIKALGLNS